MALVKVQQKAFDTAAEIKKLTKQHGGIGALVTFTGLVRGSNQAGNITTLSLEHYPAMTEKEIDRIAREAETRWPLQACLIIHRYGDLKPGEPIVFVATASGHRKDAFEAAEFLMDWLKTRAPFWKRENAGKDGAWVEAKKEDDDLAGRWQ